MLRSLRAKMTLLVLILGVPFLLASVLGLLNASEQANLQERKSIAKRAFNRLARDLKGPNPRSRIGELYDQAGLDALGAGAALVDREGNLLWGSKNRSPGNATRGTQQLVLEEGILLFVMPEKQASADLNLLVFAITGVGLLVYGAGAWLLVGATLKPISKLVEGVVGARNDQNLTITPPSSDREVVRLVETLNTLIHEVRTESDERIKSYATLSHELRTPIHSLLLKLDLTLGREQTKEDLESTMVEVQSQVYRLKNVSEAVLTLQRLSQSSSESSRETMQIRHVFEEIWEELQPLMELRKVTLDLKLSDDAPVQARREHLLLLLRNLLENSVKHSPPGSVVLIETDYTGSTLAVRFSNPSTTNAQLAGNGLGLRICQEIARVNTWKFETFESNGVFSAHVTFRS